MPGDSAKFARGDAPAWEAAFAQQIRHEYASAREPRLRVDFRSLDQRRVIELKLSLQGVRDLSAAVLQLAFVLGDAPSLERATLVAHVPKMSVARVRAEWLRTLNALRPELSTRLALAALAADGDLQMPKGDPELKRLTALARVSLDDVRAVHAPTASSPPWSSKQFEIWKVLLDAWLRCEEALPIQELSRRSGASPPTIAAVLARLHQRRELMRSSNRSASLAAFPTRSLGEVNVLADDLRGTTRFVDGSGRRPDPASLLRRLARVTSPTAAVGGVTAARHYMPAFDLNGLPRVDLSVSAQDKLDWITEVDPALRASRTDERPPVLVVHRVSRPHMITEPSEGGLPFADPAETLLDLYELRLISQAVDFVRALRHKENSRE